MGKELLAFVVMVIVQLGFAGMIIISKLVMDGGMNPFVQSAYRPIFATISIAPFAFYFERYLMFESWKSHIILFNKLYVTQVLHIKPIGWDTFF